VALSVLFCGLRGQFILRDEQLNQRLVERIKTDPHASTMYDMQTRGAHPE
jgi:hypothetical protein